MVCKKIVHVKTGKFNRADFAYTMSQAFNSERSDDKENAVKQLNARGIRSSLTSLFFIIFVATLSVVIDVSY